MPNYTTETAQELKLDCEQSQLALDIYNCMKLESIDFNKPYEENECEYSKEAFDYACTLVLEHDEDDYTPGNVQCYFLLDLAVGGLLISSDETINIDVAAAFIQILLKHFSIQEYVYLDVAHSCSSHEPDAFGGSAVFITANEIKHMCTNEWIGACINTFKSQMEEVA
mgnify:CR=1 FL=1